MSVTLREPTEKDIQRAGCNALRMFGFAVWNLSQARASKQTPGIADTFITGRGMCVWIEWKSRRGRLSPEQLQFRKEVIENGGMHLVFRSLEEVVQWISNLNGKRKAI